VSVPEPQEIQPDHTGSPGATVGLIIALIGIYQELATRDLSTDPGVRQALINMDQDASVAIVTDAATSAILLTHKDLCPTSTPTL
jgi:hypothetical protein